MARPLLCSMSRRVLAVGLGVSFLLVPVSAPGEGQWLWPEPKKSPRCVPEFPITDEWLGGDAATSIPISPRGARESRTLWLFGDTFIAREPGQSTRKDSFFLNNTIAHSTCKRNGRWEIEYGWRHTPDGKPATVLVPPSGAGFYWPVAGAAVRRTPFVLVERIIVKGQTFSVAGVDVARIANPRQHPDRWKVRYSFLAGPGSEVPASAAIVSGNFFYILSYLSQPLGRPRYMSRIALDALESFPKDLSGHLEVWTGPASGWQVGGKPEILMDDLGTEMGLQTLPEGCGFITTTLLPIQTGETSVSRRIYMRTAMKLEGPWSERRMLATVPELDMDNANGFVPKTFCYAAKLHPQLSSPANLLYTYVCNASSFLGGGIENLMPRGRPMAESVLTAMNLYIPRPVSMSIPTPQNKDGLVSDCPWLIDAEQH